MSEAASLLDLPRCVVDRALLVHHDDHHDDCRKPPGQAALFVAVCVAAHGELKISFQGARLAWHAWQTEMEGSDLAQPAVSRYFAPACVCVRQPRANLAGRPQL